MSDSYATTYCNYPHRISDGKPIGHGCYVIPPEAIRAEREGNTERACELMATARRLGKMRAHRGLKITDMEGK